ncbi:MAG TPA: 2-hydroxychromene-2-carboxylate isomerase [Rhodobacteraceae bacterium]|nr:2-hydroxychromene-2-carboxylate isomerase [Paracoccaceae bacterium]
MAHIDYYFATTSPFTYLAGMRLEDIAKKHEATITYKPLDLLALFSRTGGTAPIERHPNRQEYRLQELRRRARRAGLPINLKPTIFPLNPAPSSYALIAAQKSGGGDVGALAFGFLKAYWAEDRNIAEDDVIRDCLSGAGFDPGLADSGLLSGAETYSSNLEEAVLKGVFGAPFYITEDDERFWGHDRLDDLDLHLAGEI